MLSVLKAVSHEVTLLPVPERRVKRGWAVGPLGTAYYAISGSLEAVQLDQLGSRIMNVLKGHLLVLEHAFDLLTGSPANPQPEGAA